MVFYTTRMRVIAKSLWAYIPSKGHRQKHCHHRGSKPMVAFDWQSMTPISILQ